MMGFYLPMFCQPFSFLINVNVGILDNEVKDERLIRCDDDLPIYRLRLVTMVHK